MVITVIDNQRHDTGGNSNCNASRLGVDRLEVYMALKGVEGVFSHSFRVMTVSLPVTHGAANPKPRNP